MSITKVVRLGRRGQMVLPKEIREALGLGEGDSFVIVLQQEGQALIATPESYATLTRGLLRGTWGKSREAVERFIQEEREAWKTASG